MLKLSDAINKKIFVFRSEEEERLGYISSIQEVSQDNIAIAVPYSKRVPLNLRDEDIVNIKLLGEGEYYLLTHRFLGVRKDNIPLYLLSLPENIKRVQRREYVRFSSVFNVKYKKQAGDFLIGKTLDISGGGLRLVVHSPINVGTVLAIEFTLPGETRDLQLEAKVVRSDTIEVGGGRVNSVGLRFLNISEGQQQYIISFIFNKMAQQRRRMNEGY